MPVRHVAHGRSQSELALCDLEQLRKVAEPQCPHLETAGDRPRGAMKIVCDQAVACSVLLGGHEFCLCTRQPSHSASFGLVCPRLITQAVCSQ